MMKKSHLMYPAVLVPRKWTNPFRRRTCQERTIRLMIKSLSINQRNLHSIRNDYLKSAISGCVQCDWDSSGFILSPNSTRLTNTLNYIWSSIFTYNGNRGSLHCSLRLVSFHNSYYVRTCLAHLQRSITCGGHYGRKWKKKTQTK